MDLYPPINYYTKIEAKPLMFHLIDVGEGLMILIVFPDNTTMLFDCNVTQENSDRVISYLAKHIPSRYDREKDTWAKWIDIFVNSHRDCDHYRGLREVNTMFGVKSIWDSGQTGLTTQDDDYTYYMQLRRTLRNKYGEDSVLVPIPSHRPIAICGAVSIYCLCSSQALDETRTTINIRDVIAELREAKIQHTNAIVLTIKYAGRSILLTSDSDWKAWKEKIVPNFAASGLLAANILVASHHGSRSFFTDEIENDTIDSVANPNTTYVDSIYYIKPSITLIPCGDYEIAHHPNEDAMDIYKSHSAYRQVYTTDNKGSFVGFINQTGNWTISPIRFQPRRKGNGSFEIKCIASYKGTSYESKSGDHFPIW